MGAIEWKQGKDLWAKHLLCWRLPQPWTWKERREKREQHRGSFVCGDVSYCMQRISFFSRVECWRWKSSSLKYRCSGNLWWHMKVAWRLHSTTRVAVPASPFIWNPVSDTSFIMYVAGKALESPCRPSAFTLPQGIAGAEATVAAQKKKKHSYWKSNCVNLINEQLGIRASQGWVEEKRQGKIKWGLNCCWSEARLLK